MKLCKYLIILFIFSVSAQAEVQVNKDWVWDLSGSDFVYAGTVNQKGRILGQYCFFNDANCYYLVGLGITCDEGSEYPSILNSEAGVRQVRLICGHKNEEENMFFIKPFDDIDDLVKKAKSIGFAVAMESGKFKVVRFSLSGSTYAIEMMRAGAILINTSKPEIKTKDKSEQYL